LFSFPLAPSALAGETKRLPAPSPDLFRASQSKAWSWLDYRIVIGVAIKQCA
jgi:hypothetical protein